MDDKLYQESEQLAQEKIDARMRLLSMPPEEAQKLVEQTLYPQYWKFRLEDNVWEESIPTHYREIDTEKSARHVYKHKSLRRVEVIGKFKLSIK